MTTQSPEYEAFVHLMHQHAQMLVRFAASIVRDYDDAQDIVQEVFASLWERWNSVEVRRNVKAYLLQATHNRSVSFIRSEQSRARLQGKVAEEVLVGRLPVNEGADNIEASDLARVMRQAIDNLRPRTREIFLLHRQQGLEYAEIAELLGISLNTVHNQMSQAVQALSAVLSSWREGV